MASPSDEIPDFELIRRMAEQELDFSAAREAWAEFYVRHHRFLLRISRLDHAYLLGTDGVRDLVQQAFLKAFERATTFGHAENCDVAVQERKCRGWLARIAENLVRDRFRDQPEIALLDDGELDQFAESRKEDADAGNLPEDLRLTLLRSGIALLSEVEQTILRATMFWWQANQEHQRMPNQALQELARQVGKSPENVRQIRSRAVKKLQKHVNDNLHNEKAN